MSLANYATYKQKAEFPHQTTRLVKAATIGVGGRAFSTWAIAPGAGAAPAAAAVPTRATAGAFGQQNSANTQRLIRAVSSIGSSSGQRVATLKVADRLSHQGGLSGTTTGAQTTNLPTAALTRYTTGVGVFAAIEIYTAVGATPVNLTASYTNQAGTAGRTSPATAFGGTGFNEAGRLIILPLQTGDTGVRSVESVTLDVSTGTAGNFGVTLFRPVFTLPMPITYGYIVDPLITGDCCLEPIVDNACLFGLAWANANTTAIACEFAFSED